MDEKTFIDYDKENDLLFLYRKQRSKGSVEIGSLVIDISDDGRIVGLEIFDASRVLSDVTGMKVTKSMLDSVKTASLKVTYRPDSILIAILLKTLQEKEISARLYPIPRIGASSPEMAA